MAYETRPFVNGCFSAANAHFPVRNPYNGELIAEVGRADAAMLDAALAAAEAAGPVLAALPPYKRAELLQRISSLILAKEEYLARLIMQEAGKPITLARAEVKRAAGTFAIAADEARRYAGELCLQEAYAPSGGKYALIGRFPVTPVLAITPFNFPLNLTAHKVAPALAVGCAVIHKPASYTPLTALALAEIYAEAEAPAGAYNVVPAFPADMDSLVRSERIRKISFTGSADIGWALKAACGRKRITLELGGNAAVVIDEVSDIPSVAKQVALGAFAYAGQVCISIQRIFVQERLYGEFALALADYTMKSVRSGDPVDPEVINGPMISQQDVERVSSWVKDAQACGASVLCGGIAQGRVFMPAIISGAPLDAKVCAEEAFAPIAVIAPYGEFNEAVAMVNNSRFGLQAGYFTNDLAKANYAYENTEAGAVLINDTPIARLDHLPYGGVKDSGFGREGPRAAMDELTEPRLFVPKPPR
jgi:acyl-CoA reductase-like NAD-dependent aldehyde dehydrogenase